MSIPENRQYLAVKFKPDAARTYTYHNDGPPIAVGERVKVPAFRGDGWQPATVDAIVTEPPKFETKAVLGFVGDGEQKTGGDKIPNLFSGKEG